MNSAAPLLTTPTERLHLACHIIKAAVGGGMAALTGAGHAADALVHAPLWKQVLGSGAVQGIKNSPAALGRLVSEHPRTALGIGAGAGALGGAGVMGMADSKPTLSEQISQLLRDSGHWIGEHPGMAAAGALGLGGAGTLAAMLARGGGRRRRDDE